MQAILDFFAQYGEIGLFFYSIIETITPLAGVEILFIFLMELGATWWVLSLNTTIANAIGTAIVYYFMAKENNWIVRKFIKPETRKKAQQIFNKYGHWAIFIFAMTPLPYFVIVFIAAFSKMNLKTLILSTIFSRGLRFFITTFIIHYFSGVNTLELVLILFGISLPIMGLMYLAERRITTKL
jgi:membrane protein YqaA with SNARE-associated domain